MNIFCFRNTGHCRKIQRACCQEVPPCPQAHSRAPEALHPGWVPRPHHPTSPPMEHASSHLSTSTPPSTSASSRMALICLVSGTLTKLSSSTLCDWQERWHWMCYMWFMTFLVSIIKVLFFLYPTVHRDMWRRSAGQDGPMSGPREALSWLCPPC